MSAFEIIEHTADAGVTAHGATLDEVFVEVARGMYSLMVDLDAVRPSTARELNAEGRDSEHLLTNWLLDLLLLTETEGLVFSEFEAHVEVDMERVRGIARGEPLDEGRHGVQALVKGVTRHMLSVRPEDGGYRATVVFDL